MPDGSQTVVAVRPDQAQGAFDTLTRAFADDTTTGFIALDLSGTLGTGYAATTPNVVMAATAMASAPTLVLFLVLRRHFMDGLKVASI